MSRPKRDIQSKLPTSAPFVGAAELARFAEPRREAGDRIPSADGWRRDESLVVCSFSFSGTHRVYPSRSDRVLSTISGHGSSSIWRNAALVGALLQDACAVKRFLFPTSLTLLFLFFLAAAAA